jgi:hypothetical protein
MKKTLSLLLILGVFLTAAYAGSKSVWREATPAELEAFLPARAPVEGERIETEMRTASGIISNHNQLIAGVTLITAGYAAQGKYSHYLLTQSPFTIAENIALPPGAYVLGWQHSDNGLLVNIYEAATGVKRGTATARPITQFKGVESLRIWALPGRKIIQIGRFYLPYATDE